MAGGRERTDAYHQQFAESIIRALKEGTAPWQKPCPPCQERRSRTVSS